MALYERYKPPSRDDLCNTLIPAWYSVEKENVIWELAMMKKVAITCDCWSSLAQGQRKSKRSWRNSKLVTKLPQWTMKLT